METHLLRQLVWRRLPYLLSLTIAACGGGAGEIKSAQTAAESTAAPPASAGTNTPDTASPAIPDSTATSSTTAPDAPAQTMPPSNPVSESPTTPVAIPDAISISANVFGSPLTISMQKRFASAIASLRFRGQEYINTADHGRLMQSASSFDHYGECYNPTEAGSRDDGSKTTTTSVLLHASAGERWLETETDMAFWLAPGTDYGQTCGERTDTRQAVNTSRTGHHVLAKRVVLSAGGMDNVIGYFVQFNVPEYHSSAVFEAATVYTPKSFSKRLVFDPSSSTVSASVPFGEQSLPVILSTTDNQHAIGLFSPDLPRNGVGYGTFSFLDTNKINCVFRENGIQPGAYRYRCFFVVGSLVEVMQTIGALDAARASIGWQ